jgi:tetratricopeptide (TPR) repeat protein
MLGGRVDEPPPPSGPRPRSRPRPPETSRGGRPWLSLGPFDVLEVLGEGSAGVVWRGRHRETRTPVAVKILDPRTPWNERRLESFRTEVEAAARLDHGGVIQVFDHGRLPSDAPYAPDTPYLVMELASAGAVRPSTYRDWGSLRALLLQILDALAHAHARGVVHRDLKAGNVLLARADDPRPGLKLSDFGIAHLTAPGSPARGLDRLGARVLGTPSAMAPEQIHGRWRDVGPWTDLYALACLAWAIATGVRPFVGADVAETLRLHLQGRPSPFVPRFPAPEGLEAWLRRALAPEPRDRFACAADARRALPDSLPEPESPDWRRSESGPAPELGVGLALFGVRRPRLVGREQERDALWACLREVAASGRPRLVALRGPPGVGKSRLAEWLVERARELGLAHAVRAQHGPGAATGLGLIGMLQAELRTVGLEAEPARQRVRDWATGRLPDDDVDALSALLTEALTAVDPEDRRALIHRALSALAAERPLIVWLDDIEHGGEAIALAEHVLRRGREPILIVLTGRADALGVDEEHEERCRALLAHPEARALEVDRLPDAEHAQLVRTLLGLDDRLLQTVLGRTAGNPMFTVQILEDWVERGVLSPGPDGLRLRAGVLPTVPADVRGLWIERARRVLDPLGATALDVMRAAAALGEEVDRREWEATCVLADLEPATGVLEAASRGGLIEIHHGSFTFTHALLRESLADEAAERPIWARVNLACARMVRAVHGPHGALDRVGRHLLAAGELDEGLTTLIAAAEILLARGDAAGARSALSARLEALDAHGADRADPRRRQGQVLLARLARVGGRLIEARRIVQQVKAEAEAEGEHGLAARATLELGRVALELGDVGAAREALGEALDSPAVRAVPRLELDARREWAWASLRAGLVRTADRTFQELEAVAEGATAARCAFGRAEAARARGLGDEALAHLERARAGLEVDPVPGARAELAQLEAHRRWLSGDVEGAVAAARESSDRYARLGSARFVLPALVGALWTAARADAAAAARDFVRLRHILVGQARIGLLLAADAGLVAGAAATADWARLDTQLARAELAWTRSALVWIDVVEVLERAAARATAAGQDARGTAIARLAHEQRVALTRG